MNTLKKRYFLIEAKVIKDNGYEVWEQEINEVLITYNIHDINIIKKYYIMNNDFDVRRFETIEIKEIEPEEILTEISDCVYAAKDEYYLMVDDVACYTYLVRNRRTGSEYLFFPLNNKAGIDFYAE